MTSDDYELAEAALASADGCELAAMRMLRDECGWTLRQALDAVRRVKLMSEAPLRKVDVP